MSDDIMNTDPTNTASASTDTGPGENWVQGFSPLSTGTRIGELTIQSVLGAGEYGITYVTEHTGRGKRYALKEYFPRAIAFRDGPTVRAPSAGSAEFTWGLDRFLAESRALQKLRHPALIAVHGVTETGGTAYVGMTYEQGRDFSIWRHELRRLPTQEELDKILTPLLQGLEIAHAAGLFHLDISPECVLIRDNDTPVLLDFGGYRAGIRRRTKTAKIAKHPYVAPEQLFTESDETGPCTDIYGLAAVLYQAVTGRAPPPAHDRTAGMELASAVSTTEGRYRADFLAAIDTALEVVPNARPRNVAAWRDQLMRLPASRLGLRHNAAAAAVPAGQPSASGAQFDAAARQDPAPSDGDSDLPENDASNTEILMENQGFRSIFYGVVGLLGGAVAGALSSIVVASITNPECTSDSCVGPIMPAMAAIGAVVGAWLGARYGNQPPAHRGPDRDAPY